jgi:hypothetical protein
VQHLQQRQKWTNHAQNVKKKEMKSSTQIAASFVLKTDWKPAKQFPVGPPFVTSLKK